MNCAETRELLGAYLDSELDARTVQEIRHHLAGCPECARHRQEEQDLIEALRDRLKTPTASEGLWEAEEAFVVAAFQRQSKPDAAGEAAPANSTSWWGILRQVLWPNPAYYAGLAAVWLVLLATNPGVSGGPRPVAAGESRVTRDLRVALSRQQKELRELLGTSESSSASAYEESLPPRSQRHETHQNTGLAPWRPPLIYRPASEPSLA